MLGQQAEHSAPPRAMIPLQEKQRGGSKKSAMAANADITAAIYIFYGKQRN